MIDQGRRSFIKKSVTLSAGIAAGGLPLDALAKPVDGPRNAFNNPTFRALMETVLPGKETDPTGAPGALEAGTLEFIDALDREGALPMSLAFMQWLSCRALNLISWTHHLRPFRKLSREHREKVVAEYSRIKGAPLMLELIRAPFYTGANNRLGYDYLGYPGASEGYMDFSFNEEIGFPHPRSRSGNLP